MVVVVGVVDGWLLMGGEVAAVVDVLLLCLSSATKGVVTAGCCFLCDSPSDGFDRHKRGRRRASRRWVWGGGWGMQDGSREIAIELTTGYAEIWSSISRLATEQCGVGRRRRQRGRAAGVRGGVRRVLIRNEDQNVSRCCLGGGGEGSSRVNE